jgi:integrase
MRRTTGHVRERSPGSFELRYSLGAGPASGKRKIATATVHGTRKDAERELRRLLRAIDTGEHIESDKIPARQWFEQWLKMARPEISPLTYRLYDQAVRLYLPHPRFRASASREANSSSYSGCLFQARSRRSP